MCFIEHDSRNYPHRPCGSTYTYIIVAYYFTSACYYGTVDQAIFVLRGGFGHKGAFYANISFKTLAVRSEAGSGRQNLQAGPRAGPVRHPPACKFITPLGSFFDSPPQSRFQRTRPHHAPPSPSSRRRHLAFGQSKRVIFPTERAQLPTWDLA